MKKIKYALIALCCVQHAWAAETVHWGYADPSRPEQWANLTPAYQLCSTGQNQSPINITDTYTSLNKHYIEVEYNFSPHDIVFNGHTVQVNTADYRDYVVLDRQKYFLKQFHFHTPSENQIQGKHYVMELHFVHQNAQQQYVVLAVMFELGRANPEWEKFWQDLSPEVGEDKILTHTINLESLLPKKHEYYRTTGSLTTPPCTEGVIWIILKQPLSLSQVQLDEFRQLLQQHRNNRPIQPSHGRVIVED